MFTVMGITGKVGGAVAENLLAAGKTVRGVVRNPEKAKAWADRGVELVQSAYDDAAGLAKAFAGSRGCVCDDSTGLCAGSRAAGPEAHDRGDSRGAWSRRSPARLCFFRPSVRSNRADWD